MIELIEDYHAAARQTRPEVFQTTHHDIVEAGIEIDEFELHVRISLEEVVQLGREIQFVNVNYVVQMLRANQTH